MIAFLEGKVLLCEPQLVIIIANGVGYRVSLLKHDSEQIRKDEQKSFYIYTNVKEDAIDLYGFTNLLEKQAFQMLLSISGIGPKIAMNILSALKLENLIEALISKDYATLCKIPGIGKKSAERMVLELKEKALKIRPQPKNAQRDISAFENLHLAIKGLGFSKDQCDLAIKKLEHEDLLNLPLDLLIKKALNILMTGSKYGNSN